MVKDSMKRNYMRNIYLSDITAWAPGLESDETLWTQWAEGKTAFWTKNRAAGIGHRASPVQNQDAFGGKDQ